MKGTKAFLVFRFSVDNQARRGDLKVEHGNCEARETHEKANGRGRTSGQQRYGHQLLFRSLIQ